MSKQRGMKMKALWHIYDKQTGKLIARAKSEDNARAKADKLNQKAGCYRYSFRLPFPQGWEFAG
jgi:hypothetical protein